MNMDMLRDQKNQNVNVCVSYLSFLSRWPTSRVWRDLEITLE